MKSLASVSARITAIRCALTVRCLRSGDRSRSDRQTLAALRAPGVDDGPTTACFHANQKAVGAGAASLRSLVSAFHDVSSEKYRAPVAEALRQWWGRRHAGSGQRAIQGLSHMEGPCPSSARSQGNPGLDQESLLPSKLVEAVRVSSGPDVAKLGRFRSVDNLPFRTPFRLDCGAFEARFFTT